MFVHIWLDRSTFSHFSRYSPGGNLLEIFLLPRFLPYRLTRNFYPLIRKSSSKGERGENPYSKRSFLDEILSENAYSTFIRKNCFTMRLFLSWISFIVSTSSYFFVFFCFSLPTEKRMNESNLFESGRKYRFVEILISNYLFVSLFVSIVGKYSREIDLLHKKILLNVFNLFLEI